MDGGRGGSSRGRFQGGMYKDVYLFGPGSLLSFLYYRCKREILRGPPVTAFTALGATCPGN